jgi:hypothetical protein
MIIVIKNNIEAVLKVIMAKMIKIKNKILRNKVEINLWVEKIPILLRNLHLKSINHLQEKIGLRKMILLIIYLLRKLCSQIVW